MNDFETKLKMIDKLVSSNKELEEWTNKYLSIVDEEEKVCNEITQKAISLINAIIGEDLRRENFDFENKREMKRKLENRLYSCGLTLKKWNDYSDCVFIVFDMMDKSLNICEQEDFTNPQFTIDYNKEKMQAQCFRFKPYCCNNIGIYDYKPYNFLHEKRYERFACIADAKKSTEHLVFSIKRNQEISKLLDLIADKILNRLSH